MNIRKLRPVLAGAMALSALFGMSQAAVAQITTVDPDQAIDGDLSAPQTYPAPATVPVAAPPADPAYEPLPGNGTPAADGGELPTGAPATVPPAVAANVQTDANTYQEDDLIGAAEGVFGKGAKGLADVIQDILKKQGRPNGYIVGREGGGAFAVGVRYGSGTLHHKIEGEMPVYWTGPSIGFDAGANAGSAFILVYNLYDTADLFKRFPAGEGQAYLIGGFNVSYLRRGNIVLIPVRVGAGLRLGVNAGYLRFSHKQRWVPF